MTIEKLLAAIETAEKNKASGLPHLLDLLADCGWVSMELDDMEAIAKRASCGFHCGVSKGVFIRDDWSFVIKVPYYGEDASCDYCEEEVNAYQTIEVNYPDCLPMFTPTIYLGEYGEMKVYAQERIASTFCWHFTSRKEMELTDTFRRRCADDAETKNIFTLTDGSRLAEPFLELLFEVYAKNAVRSLAEWIADTHQSDLHDANVGFDFADKPRIFDFSGWWD